MAHRRPKDLSPKELKAGGLQPGGEGAGWVMCSGCGRSWLPTSPSGHSGKLPCGWWICFENRCNAPRA